MYISSITYSRSTKRHIIFFFFFSSRRRHTRFDCDWSSDVCSSDLGAARRRPPGAAHHRRGADHRAVARSEEHTSELQSQSNLVCRLLLEKKKKSYRLVRCIHTRSTETTRDIAVRCVVTCYDHHHCV